MEMQISNTCNIHKEKLNNFCTVCKKFVCYKCIGVEHFQHGIIFVHMMTSIRNSNEKIEIITKHISQIETLQKDINSQLVSSLNDLQTMKQDLIKNNESINEIFNSAKVDDSIKSILLSSKAENGEEGNADIKQYMQIQYDIKNSVQSLLNQVISNYQCAKLADISTLSFQSVHSFTNNSLLLALYHPTTKVHKLINLTSNVPDQAETVSCNNRLFVSGGYINGIYQNTMKEFDEIKLDLASRQNMSVTRTRHAVVAMNSFIAVCGGYNGSQTSSCEKYSVVSNSWQPLPQLIQARDTCGICFFNNKSLYIFCGYFTSYRIKNCEKLDITPLGSTWISISIDEGTSGWGIRDALHCCDIGSNSMLIFGGNDGSISNKCFIAKLATDNGIKIEAAPYTLSVGSEFVFTSATVQDGSKIYSVDNARNIHIFDMSASKWDVIYKNSWYS